MQKHLEDMPEQKHQEGTHEPALSHHQPNVVGMANQEEPEVPAVLTILLALAILVVLATLEEEENPRQSHQLPCAVLEDLMPYALLEDQLELALSPRALEEPCMGETLQRGDSMRAPPSFWIVFGVI